MCVHLSRSFCLSASRGLSERERFRDFMVREEVLKDVVGGTGKDSFFAVPGVGQ